MKNKFKIDLSKVSLFVGFALIFVFGFAQNSMAQAILCYTNGSVSLTADSYSVTYGQSTTIRWNSSGQSSCTLSDSNGESFDGTSGSVSSGPITSQRNFSLSCHYGAVCIMCGIGACSKGITVNVVVPPPAPTVKIQASASKVDMGGTSIISWQTTGADSCTNSSTLGNWNPTSFSGGSQTVQNITSNQVFSLDCKNGSGETTASTSVGVNASLFASPLYITAGLGNTLLNWVSALGNSCTISISKPIGSRFSYTGLAADYTLSNSISSNTLFNLNCSQTDGTLSTSSVLVYTSPRLNCPAK